MDRAAATSDTAGTGRLVFDLGFHRGEDTEHYLAMGHRVVAVEADPGLWKKGTERFSGAIDAQRLVLLNAAVVGAGRGLSEVHFHPHGSRSEWGSVDPRWVRRNKELFGSPNDPPVSVVAISLPELVHCHGCPWYLKIDIEGADEEVLEDLSVLDELPEYVSWETGKESYRSVRARHRSMHALGYDRFRIVQQCYQDDRPAVMSKEGFPVHLLPGSSGPLPADLPQPWRSLEGTLRRYLLLFLIYRLIGPGSIFQRASRSERAWLSALPKRIVAWADRRRMPFPGWYDSHARWNAGNLRKQAGSVEAHRISQPRPR